MTIKEAREEEARKIKLAVSNAATEIAGCVCFDMSLPASDKLWDITHRRVMQFIPNLLKGDKGREGNNEADEISQEDLEAAGEVYDALSDK